jgi:hypothetical protein
MSQVTMTLARSIEAAAPHLEIGRELGRDGPVQVFEARQIDANRRIRLRVCPLTQCALGRTAAQIQSALARLKSLKHPVVVSTFSGGVAGDVAYFETEYGQGRPIAAFVETNRLSDRQLVEFAAKLCEGLGYLHSQGIGYGELLPNGLTIARAAGSLRVAPKLSRVEGMHALKADGSDQRAFAALLSSLLAKRTGGVDSPVIGSLQDIARRCAATRSSAPSFNEIALELKSLGEQQNIDYLKSALHFAEPLLIAPPAPAKPSFVNFDMRGGYWVLFVAIGITAGIVSGIVNRDDRRNTPQTSTLKPSWQAPSGLRVDVPYRPEDTASSNDTAAPEDTSFGGGGADSNNSRPGMGTISSNTAYHFTPSPRLPSRPGYAAERIGIVPPVDMTPTEDFILSNPTFATDEYRQTVLTMDVEVPQEAQRIHRMVWVIEAGDDIRLQAHLIPRLEAGGTIRGRIAFGMDNQLKPPISTYFAEETTRMNEPRRVSNLLSVPEPE